MSETTNNNVTTNTNERPEPFSTILELITEHGEDEVLQSLSDYFDFESENEDICDRCREKAERIHHVLETITLAEI